MLFIICYFMVQIFRKLKMNPDDCCIPLLTGLGDIFGALLLYSCFYSLSLINSPVAMINNGNTTNINSTLSFNQTANI